MCEYNYYKDGENYYPRLYCSIDNTYCIYSYKCTKHEKFLPMDNQEECYKYNMAKKKSIPNGSKYIEFKRKGFLYVEINDDHVVKIFNTLGEFDQDYVYVKDGVDGYEISLVPFVEKKTTIPRKKSNEKQSI